MAAVDLRGDNPLRDFTAALIDEAARSDADKPFGIYYLAGGEDFAALARTVEREVFMAWFGNDEAVMDEEYNPFDATSDFVLCVDHARCEPAGAIRVIRPSPIGLKTLNDVEAAPSWGVDSAAVIAHHPCPSGLGATFDVATLAVRPDWSGGDGLQVSHSLYCGLYRWAVARGVEQFVTLLDDAPYRLLESLGIPLLPLCGLGAAEYLGSPSTTPTLIDVIETSRLMRQDPALRELLAGAGAMQRYSMPTVTLHESWAVVDGVETDDDSSPTTDIVL